MTKLARESGISHLPANKRILIVDALPVVRAGVAAAFNNCSGWTVCGEAANHRDTLCMIEKLKPNLATLGLNTENYHWLELLKDIRVKFPTLLILVVSTQGESLYARRAIEAGAHGFVTMQEAIAEVVRATEALLAGETYVSRHVMAQIAGRIAGRKHNGRVHSFQDLTERELEVFELTGAGLSVRQIAEHLNLGKSTVETYRSHIKKKFRLQDNTELLQSAIRWKCSGTLRPD